MNHNLHVAMIAPSWPPSHSFNGVTTYVDALARQNAAIGVRTTILTQRLMPCSSDDLPAKLISNRDGIWEKMRHRWQWSVVRSKWPRADIIAESIAAALRPLAVDIVEIEDAFGASAILKQIIKQPVVVRLHGPHFVGAFGPLTADDVRRCRREGEAFRSADGVTSPSPGLLSATISEYGSVGEPNAVIPNPVAPTTEGSVWRSGEADPDLILFVGRFDLRKGGDIMMDAFAQLAARRKALRLRFLGRDIGVPTAEGGNASLSAYLAAPRFNSIRDRIIFEGPAPLPELLAHRLRAAVTVVPSRFETYGYAAFEALSLGCPVVVTDTFGPAEYFEAGRDVEVAVKGDADSLAAAIERLLDNPNRAAEIGANGRRATLDLCDSERVARQTLRFYSAVLEKAPLYE